MRLTSLIIFHFPTSNSAVVLGAVDRGPLFPFAFLSSEAEHPEKAKSVPEAIRNMNNRLNIFGSTVFGRRVTKATRTFRQINELGFAIRPP